MILMGTYVNCKKIYRKIAFLGCDFFVQQKTKQIFAKILTKRKTNDINNKKMKLGCIEFKQLKERGKYGTK